MMALLRLALRHEYGPSALTGLRLAPSPATGALCRQYGLLVHSGAQGLALYGPKAALPALWQAQRAEGCDYLLVWRLACKQSLYALTSADDAPSHVLLPLATCSALDTDCQSWCARVAHTREVTLAARRCQWKYLLLGDWASLAASGLREDLRISINVGTFAASHSLQFIPDADVETLPDGRQARVYRSPNLLPLAERSSCRVALSDAGSVPARVLMGALPHGAPGNLQRDSRVEGAPWVTEIFLTR